IEDMQPVFESTQSLLVELEMDALTQLDLAQSMLLPDPYRLTDFFSEAEFQQIVRLMRGRIEGARLKVVKPWVVFVQLYSARSDAEQTMDMLIAHNYHQLKKPVKGLESVSRQLSVFDALSYQQQAALVRRALEIYQVQSATLNQRLFQYYRRGDLINLWVLQEQFVEDMGPIFVPLNQATLGGRNRDMLERIMTSTPRAAQLIAVGALHLPGSDGLLCLLEGKGYRVRPAVLGQR
ncbi:MAG: TraB/GumN family protein, partial [Gammaproteobacteria bacterium]